MSQPASLMENDPFDDTNILDLSVPQSANAFSRIIGTDPSPATASLIIKDKCKRPTVTYNSNYHPEKPPPDGQLESYSLYVFGEPLFDDRPVDIRRLPPRYVLSTATTRPLTSWVWKLGYRIDDNSKAKKRETWMCKLCMYIRFFS